MLEGYIFFVLSLQPQHGDVEIASYSHNDIDRFAVLLDLWSNEAAFLECKKEVWLS